MGENNAGKIKSFKDLKIWNIPSTPLRMKKHEIRDYTDGKRGKFKVKGLNNVKMWLILGIIGGNFKFKRDL